MNYLAIDLGAESGRLILGSIKDGKIQLKEIHRFPNGAVKKNDSLLWNFDQLTQGVFDGLRETSHRNLSIQSISTDSWGVDYVMDPNEVFNYRDARGPRGVEKLLKQISWEQIFAETGIQFMPINTLFQLASETKNFNACELILSVADFFNHRLGGGPVIEESMASTFQIYNPRKRDWSETLLNRLGLPRTALPKVVQSGTPLGNLHPQFAWPESQNAKIIATCSHDTGCAVAAVPATGKNWAYLSSGTWSLMGVEIPPISNLKSQISNSAIRSPHFDSRSERQLGGTDLKGLGSPSAISLTPIITDQSRALNFTNEIGYGSTIRLLKNISGLWLLQECRRAWTATGQNFDYAELTHLAQTEPPTKSLIDPMDPRFLAPPSMPDAIADYCRENNLPIPATPAQYTRCILESLAQLYAKTLHQLEQLTAQKIERLHIVGGGSKNNFLNQLTANACQIEVQAGPVEATALGNIIIQAITSGEIPDLPTARQLIAQNFPTTTFNPA